MMSFKFVRATYGCTLSIFLLTGFAAFAESRERLHATPDGRFGTACYDHGLTTAASELCTVSFYRLLARTEDYDGRNIAVIGVLGSFADMPALFINGDSLKAGITEDGIFLKVPIPKEFAKELKEGIWPVLVSGRFDAHCWGGTLPFSGCFTKVFNIADMRAPHGSK